jgi:hypothetical protein
MVMKMVQEISDYQDKLGTRINLTPVAVQGNWRNSTLDGWVVSW